MGVNTSQKGFTLLEIMVAMALIGGIFITLGLIQKRQAQTQYSLEEQLAAAQLASNLLEQFVAEGTPLAPEQLVGEDKMADRLIPWTRIVKQTPDGKGYEVRVLVGKPDTTPLFEERYRWFTN